MKQILIFQWFILFFFITYFINFKIFQTYDFLIHGICLFLSPLLVSFLIFRKITLIGYFIGFVIQWIIFLNVNPYPIKNDNKLAIMNYVPTQFRPELQFSLKDIHNRRITYPIIIKHTICSGACKNIEIINSYNELQHFLINNDNEINNYMVQSYLHDYDVEIGVLWEKHPFAREGKIMEIVEKTQKDKIRKFNENNYIIHSNLINDHLNQLFNSISKTIPKMNACRYDIRLKNISDLHKGEFKILEANGTMGMSFLGHPLKNGYLKDFQWYFTRLSIGLYNIVTLQGYSPINLLIAMFKSYSNTIRCNDWENIFSIYS